VGAKQLDILGFFWSVLFIALSADLDVIPGFEHQVPLLHGCFGCVCGLVAVTVIWFQETRGWVCYFFFAAHYYAAFNIISEVVGIGARVRIVWGNMMSGGDDLGFSHIRDVSYFYVMIYLVTEGIVSLHLFILGNRVIAGPVSNRSPQLELWPVNFMKILNFNGLLERRDNLMNIYGGE